MSYTTEYKLYNQQLILITLSDEQWHRYKDLKEKTKLSSRTLSKHLNELRHELHWIEQEKDTSGKYPHSVLYRVTSAIAPYATYLENCSKIAENIERQIKENKDPISIVETLHKANLFYITSLLEEIQKKFVSKKQIEGMMNLFLFSPYQVYIETLIETFTNKVRLGAKFDFKQLKEKWRIPNGKIIFTVLENQPPQ
jgi:DNA-binding HxlR family transcriptional regulator